MRTVHTSSTTVERQAAPTSRACWAREEWIANDLGARECGEHECHEGRCALHFESFELLDERSLWICELNICLMRWLVMCDSWRGKLSVLILQALILTALVIHI